ncbi:MAG: DUF721 domain-containing protein [Candidatus Competibacteraceae bacterium]|nr:DUF721 domain-containing protein [Candidatus Competibacteraceae bacterium]
MRSAAWHEIVGEGNATFCHPLRIDRERTLVIGVSNPVVRQELLFHKAMILDASAPSRPRTTSPT